MYILKRIVDKLALVNTADASFTPISIDFASASNTYRRKHSSIRTEAIAKAVGISKYSAPLKILDVTAGLGKDAFTLACFGCQVQMIERNQMVASLLQDALARGQHCADIADYIRNMQLMYGEATQVMYAMLQADMQQQSTIYVNDQSLAGDQLYADSQLSANYQLSDVVSIGTTGVVSAKATDVVSIVTADVVPASTIDVVYLDPMFPESKKSAKVKLAMQVLRDLLQTEHATVKNASVEQTAEHLAIASATYNDTVVNNIESNHEELFALACKIATKRVVIKRHKSSAPLVKTKPNFSIAGRTVRFDIYSPTYRL